jgi:hypothetical protein
VKVSYDLEKKASKTEKIIKLIYQDDGTRTQTSAEESEDSISLSSGKSNKKKTVENLRHVSHEQRQTGLAIV